MVSLLTQCYCGCSLRTGTIIIGFLYVIGGLYVIASYSITLTAMDASNEIIDRAHDLIRKSAILQEDRKNRKHNLNQDRSLNRNHQSEMDNRDMENNLKTIEPDNLNRNPESDPEKSDTYKGQYNWNSNRKQKERNRNPESETDNTDMFKGMENNWMTNKKQRERNRTPVPQIEIDYSDMDNPTNFQLGLLNRFGLGNGHNEDPYKWSHMKRGHSIVTRQSGTGDGAVFVDRGANSRIRNGNRERKTDQEIVDDMMSEIKGTVNTVSANTKWYIILSLVVRSIELVLTLVMLIGTFMVKPNLLLPWIIGEIIIAMLVIMEYLTLGILYALSGFGWICVAYIAVLIVVLLISGYYVFVVYSHYKAMCEYKNPTTFQAQIN